MKSTCTFCDFRTQYQLASELGLFLGSLPRFHRERRSVHEARIAIGDSVARGDLQGLEREIAWYRLGRPDFKVHAGMAVALGCTKLHVPGEELKLPFPAFTVSFSPGTIFVSPDSLIPSDRPLRGQPYVRSILVTEHAGDGILTVFMILDLADDDASACHEARMALELRTGEEVSASVEKAYASLAYPGYAMLEMDRRRIAATVCNVVFLAISRERKYVERTQTRLRPSDVCGCGSGHKLKKCCGRGPDRARGAPVGFEVGREIDLPYRSSTSTGIRTGDGQELEYGHIRSGHMRRLPPQEGDDRGRPRVVFVRPAWVRRDLPLKPQLTPRRVRDPIPPESEAAGGPMLAAGGA